MNFATIRTALTSWLTALTSLPVSWKTRARSWRGSAWIDLQITNLGVNGQDVVVYENHGDDAVTPTTLGLRSFILEIQVWSHGVDDADDALQAVEKIIADIHQPATVQAFTTAGIGFDEIRSATFPLRSVGDREMSVGIIDLAFHTFSEHTGADVGAVHELDLEGEFGPVDVTMKVTDV